MLQNQSGAGFGKKNIVDKIMYRCFTIVANVGLLLAGSGYGLFKSLRLWLSIQLWFRAVKDKISKKHTQERARMNKIAKPYFSMTEK